MSLPVEQTPAASSASRPGAAGSEGARAAGDPEPAAGLHPGDALLVWTTTPWTLISNAAVAVGPKIEYVRARASDGQVYVVAASRMSEALGEDAELLSRFPGSALAGTRYEPPFPYISDYGPHGHTVLEADFVTTDEGTGLVHTAVAFGEDDFRLGERYGITLQNPVREDGTFDERVTDFAGRFVKDADADIVEALRSAGRLYRDETIVHAYPHCWRCETPLLYYAKSSWYIRTTDVRDRMLAENEEIGWHPEHIRHGRFGKWLEGNVDWAISRERYWGTPLPIWECAGEGCAERFCAGSMQDLRERGGEVPDDLHRPYVDDVVLRCAECGGEMRRVNEVIDAWYDSGAMPFAQFHYPFEGSDDFEHRFPADFICEAIDQTRGWFYSLLAVSTLLFDRASYRNAVCLGLILDPEGQKMSKSRGNVVEPWEVISTHGADALRWYYLTSQQPWAGYRFSLETVGESVRQFLLTLWNTYSFWVLYANAEGIDPAAPPLLPEPGEAPGDGDEPAARVARELDRWALSRLQATKRAAGDHLERFDSTNAGQAIAAYVEELSNWYVRLSRRRFWDGDAAAFATLRHCLLELAALLAPFTPFVAEEIYLNLAGGEDEQLGDAPDSVHLLDYPEPDAAREDRELEAAMGAARRAVELGRAARSRAGVKARQPLRRAVVAAPEADREGIAAMADLIVAELNVKELERAPSAPEGEGWGVESEGEGEAARAVALDLEIDDELRLEGLARGIVRAVQNERKGAGLDITDRIELTLGGDPELVAAAQTHEAYVAGETLATSVSYDGAAGASTAKVEGHELLVAVAKAD